MSPRKRRMVKWLIFSVLVALVPILFDMLVQLMDSAMTWPDDFIAALFKALGRGELLLISTAIAADAIGDLVGTGRTSEAVKYLAAGACVLTILFGSLWYANISAIAHAGGVQPKISRVCLGSLVVFLFTLVSSGSAKLVADEG